MRVDIAGSYVRDFWSTVAKNKISTNKIAYTVISKGRISSERVLIVRVPYTILFIVSKYVNIHHLEIKVKSVYYFIVIVPYKKGAAWYYDWRDNYLVPFSKLVL